MPTDRLDKRLENTPSEIWLKINKIDELKGQWIAGAKLSPQVLGRLKKSVLITSTGASTRIEGAKLSDEDIEKMMRGLSVQKFTDRDLQEVKGYYELLNNIFDSWKSIRFNESAIKHFHKELLKYVEKDTKHRGEYKKQENKVHMIDEAGKSVGVLFDTTPAYLTPKEMQELIDWTDNALKENIYHPLITIGNFLVEFLNIHPFIDGNGRISRVLTNLLLLKASYAYIPYISHEKLVEANKPDYYIALRRSQRTIKKRKEDIMPWLNFFLDIVLEQSKQAVELLSKENIEKLLSPKQLAVWEYLNTVDEASPSEISKKTNVARPTINQVVDKLLRLKKIDRIGLGRSTRYRKI
ncbi:MAG: Fic family protein [Candidatus Magasanikbacteria bacterium CG10_big_fil_rev_8_21_14_0_10_47_10]|uniref:Fic family protein n=1 Tax=Candidatus Magasanikbacteria bacterium CG10_big_fil_rev_8_21_14_0_10_47_10 TaxID=1974652 RepID=A0A2H0TR33_9BACT|nr:MAG: Fic family protein [Candidatus Magasanikbacteria bacterium CG10_big_fil_rev_8_21_14_0_10_47_10]